MPPVSDENSQFVSMSDSGLTAGEPSYSHTTPSPTPALAAAGTEDETQKEQQSRKRTARACDSCYKRKVCIFRVGNVQMVRANVDVSLV